MKKASALSRRELQEEIGRVRRRTKSALRASDTQMRLGSKKEVSPAARMVVECQARASSDSAKPDSRGDEESSRGTPLALANREGTGADHGSESDFGSSEIVEMPLSVGLSFTPEQFARYEALVAKLRQRGHRAKKAELILSAWKT